MRAEYQYIAASRQQAEQFQLVRIVLIGLGGLPLQADQRAIAAPQRARFPLRGKLLGRRDHVTWSPFGPLQPVSGHAHPAGEELDPVDADVRSLSTLDSRRRTVREIEPGAVARWIQRGALDVDAHEIIVPLEQRHELPRNG